MTGYGARIVLPPNRIAQLRAASGLTRPDLAAKLGLEAERTITRWETGETGIPDHRKFQLAEMFGVSVAWMMGWENGDDGDGGRQAEAA